MKDVVHRLIQSKLQYEKFLRDYEFTFILAFVQIMFYVAGFIWAEIKQLYQEGIHQYMVSEPFESTSHASVHSARRIRGIYWIGLRIVFTLRRSFFV